MCSIPRKREQSRKIAGKLWETSQKERCIKGPAVMLGSSHTGSALVKALGNIGLINFNGWHEVQNNTYFHNKVCPGKSARACRPNACVEAKTAYFYSFGAFPRSVGIFSTTRVLQRNLLCSISLCVHIFTMGLPLTYLRMTWEAQ